MKRILTLLLLILALINPLKSQDVRDENMGNVDVYLLTCGPGDEVYSVWGHTALRVVDKTTGSDIVYNWGVFDFSTKHFAWKFANGRLNYMLAFTTFDRFMQEYIYYNRWVKSQKINLNSEETYNLLSLIQENLKPENITYRYDFFYDDCSTRVRDLLEESVGNKLLYPPYELDEQTSFSAEIEKYTGESSWLDLGIDLLMGLQGQRKTTLRDRMFLPEGLSNGLAQLVINRDGKMIPVVANPVMLYEQNPTLDNKKGMFSPVATFLAILVIILLLSVIIKSKPANNILDITIFFIFSILAVLMLFFNLFTAHEQMRWNIDILWLSPLVIACLVGLVTNRPMKGCFRTVLFLSVTFAIVVFMLPHTLNHSLLPLNLILALRSFVRTGFDWNPLDISRR